MTGQNLQNQMNTLFGNQNAYNTAGMQTGNLANQDWLAIMNMYNNMNTAGFNTNAGLNQDILGQMGAWGSGVQGNYGVPSGVGAGMSSLGQGLGSYFTTTASRRTPR